MRKEGTNFIKKYGGIDEYMEPITHTIASNVPTESECWYYFGNIDIMEHIIIGMGHAIHVRALLFQSSK